MGFIFSGIIFLVWAISIIILYYTFNTSHNALLSSNGNGLLVIYFSIIFITYGIYKLLAFSKNNTSTKWSIGQIIGAFFLQLLFTCFLYVAIDSSGNAVSLWTNPSSLVLFVHILQFLLYPIFLVFLWRAVGGSIFHFIPTLSIPKKLQIMIEITLGIIVFSAAIFLLGFFKIFTLASLIITLALLSALGFFGWKQMFGEKKSVHIEKSPFSSYIISAEITFLLLNFIISVSLISILRPMPIGWDDLGVYMNFPRIIANIGALLEGSGMYVWQLITATGFLFDGTAAQAFFINQIGGILATIAIITFLSLLLEKENTKNNYKILCLPIILGIVYYIMPMTVFQQAKDMKLDPALMFVSATAFMALLYAVQNFLKNNKKQSLILFFIAGIIIGFAFSIKFTSLIFIIATLAYISYGFLGFSGLIGFSGIFIAIFTKANLWSQLFVWMPQNTTYIVLGSAIIGLIGFGISFYYFRKNFIDFLKTLIILGIGILLPLLPWLTKNIGELQGNISIAGILNGASSQTTNSESSVFYTDYSKIYTKAELQAKKENNDYAMATSDGISLNEDFARYFGQEKGLNNYLKLPANLTFQINQKGEFTDITFIFLAFVPVALLFFVNHSYNQARKQIWLLSLGFFLIFGILSILSIGLKLETILINFITSIANFLNFFSEDLSKGFLYTVQNLVNPIILSLGNFSQIFSKNITNILTDITLPGGYLVLLALIFGFLGIVHFCIQNGKIRGILTFLAIYGLIFWISAFGIVWYGVLIYFLLLIVIALGLDEGNTIQSSDDSRIKFFKNFYTWGFFLLIGVYIFFSAPLHAYKNLQSATYSEYKYYSLSQNSSIFTYKSDYFKSLIELNLLETETLAKQTSEKLSLSNIKTIFETEVPTKERNSLESLHNWFQQKVQNARGLSYQHSLYQESAAKEIAKIQASQASNTTKNQKIQQIRQSLQNKLQTIKQEIEPIRKQIAIIDPIMDEMYKQVLSPEKNNRNTAGIYRIGTFYTYFVQNNRSRFYEDSLVTNFQTYFYDENPEVVAEKMKKIGLSYLLIDLNAATIDSTEANEEAFKNNRTSLTTRFENLLSITRSDKFSLVNTDNICLQFAIEKYKAKEITSTEEFLDIAATNHIRYEINTSGQLTAIPREVAKYNCAHQIAQTTKLTDELQSQIGGNSYFAIFKINE